MAAARILVVDDESAILDMLARVLRSRGYEVETAPNAAGALEILKVADRFDLLLSDVIMPGMCGPELAAHVMRQSPTTAVVMMSAYVSGTQLPPRVGFISKPFAMKDLFAVAEKALERAQQARDPE
jgi:two-component system cell cycle sensor histidine kinase/response regulator CckA